MIIAGSCFLIIGAITFFLGLNGIYSGMFILAAEVIVAGVTMVFCGFWFLSRAEDPDLKKERKEK